MLKGSLLSALAGDWQEAESWCWCLSGYLAHGVPGKVRVSSELPTDSCRAISFRHRDGAVQVVLHTQLCQQLASPLAL